MSITVNRIRNQFPSLARPAIFFDNPGGTQIARQSAERIQHYLLECNANHEGTFAFVMYPEATPILEAWRAARELGTVGVHPGLVVANMVIPADQADTEYANTRRLMQEKYLVEIGERFQLPVVQIPLLSHEVKGLEMLAELGEQIYGTEKEAA
jgi:arsenite/tail-anchored protein-transporting ATPase